MRIIFGRIFSTLICLWGLNFSYAQFNGDSVLINRGDDNIFYSISPSYPNGTTGFYIDFKENITQSYKGNLSGKTGTVTFQVDENGNVVYPAIVKSGGKKFDKALLDAVLKLKKFQPATQKGIPILVSFVIPVSF